MKEESEELLKTFPPQGVFMRFPKSNYLRVLRVSRDPQKAKICIKSVSKSETARMCIRIEPKILEVLKLFWKMFASRKEVDERFIPSLGKGHLHSH